jgi:2-keto-4-pentenoate hydratase/2-oxohepta-3-ene-1,7-dioic acid hydratase in catechol pathway
MLIARYRDNAGIHLGVVEGAGIRPIDTASLSLTGDVSRIGVAALAACGWRDLETLPLGEPQPLGSVRLLAPVPHPEKIICVGVNYRLHAAESNMVPPAFPEIFAKYPNTIQDPEGPIVLPTIDQAVDYEGELGVVLGSVARNLTPATALEAVAGYTVGNDVSARTVQLRVSQWVTGKSPDTFCPIGPWMATAGAVGDPQSLAIATTIGNETLQSASTAQMIFTVANLLVYISALMTLRPGDIILTGTPAGVGHSRQPSRYLRAGDVVEITIERIGTLRNPVVAAQIGATPARAPSSPASSMPRPAPTRSDGAPGSSRPSSDAPSSPMVRALDRVVHRPVRPRW